MIQIISNLKVGNLIEFWFNELIPQYKQVKHYLKYVLDNFNFFYNWNHRFINSWQPGTILELPSKREVKIEFLGSNLKIKDKRNLIVLCENVRDPSLIDVSQSKLILKYNFL